MKDNKRQTHYNLGGRHYILSQARINWEGCGRKGIRHKIWGLMEVDCWLVRVEWRPPGLLISNPPASVPPFFLRRMPFLPQLSQFILAWDRDRNILDCISPWLGYPVAWLPPWLGLCFHSSELWYENVQNGSSSSVLAMCGAKKAARW